MVFCLVVFDFLVDCWMVAGRAESLVVKAFLTRGALLNFFEVYALTFLANAFVVTIRYWRVLRHFGYGINFLDVAKANVSQSR